MDKLAEQARDIFINIVANMPGGYRPVTIDVGSGLTFSFAIRHTWASGVMIEYLTKAPWGTNSRRTRYMSARDASTPSKVVRRAMAAWHEARKTAQTFAAVGKVYVLAETKAIPDDWPESEPGHVDDWENGIWTVDGHPIDYDAMTEDDVGYWLAKLATFPNKEVAEAA